MMRGHEFMRVLGLLLARHTGLVVTQGVAVFMPFRDVNEDYHAAKNYSYDFTLCTLHPVTYNVLA